MSDEKATADTAPETNDKDRKPQRKIAGNFPYTTSHGVLLRALEQIPKAERPEKFTADYLKTVLGLTGGSARAVIPILKRAGLVNSDGSPSALYSQFRSDTQRAAAALTATRAAFSEVFRRNEYAYKETDDAVRDIIVEVTGLERDDKIVRAILGTFNAFRSFVTDDATPLPDRGPDREPGVTDDHLPDRSSDRVVGLSYQINIVLPDTTDVSVYNAIFRSLRENLL